MMYAGSKSKLASRIVPVLNSMRKHGQSYVEPFMGFCSVLSRMDGPRYGNDSNELVFSLMKALQCGYEPPTHVSKDEYYRVKSMYRARMKDDTSCLHLPYVFSVLFGSSFGGRFANGYAQDRSGRNYALGFSKSATKISKLLDGAHLSHGSYESMYIPEESLIYCDPSYAGTTVKYALFNHELFYSWCHKKKAEGHTIVISEYNMPNSFKCIAEFEHRTTMNRNQSSRRIEKLFVPL